MDRGPRVFVPNMYGPAPEPSENHRGQEDANNVVARSGFFEGGPFRDVEILVHTDTEVYSPIPVTLGKIREGLLSVVVRVPGRWLQQPPVAARVELLLLRVCHQIAVTHRRPADAIVTRIVELRSAVPDEPPVHRGALPPLPRDWFGRPAKGEPYHGLTEVHLEMPLRALDELATTVDMATSVATALEDMGIAEFEGNEIGDGTHTVFLWTDDAERLISEARRLLARADAAGPVVAHVTGDDDETATTVVIP